MEDIIRGNHQQRILIFLPLYYQGKDKVKVKIKLSHCNKLDIISNIGLILLIAVIKEINKEKNMKI
jgi:hypothetical protein